jgi:hypothetical protein
LKVTTEERKIALEAERETDAAARLRIEDYLARTGLSRQAFADRIGRSYDTLRLFLTDRYHRIGASAHLLIRAADDYMAQYPIGAAFSHRGELYETENVRIIHTTFDELLRRSVAYMLYGAPGNQKSFVLEHEVAQLNRRELADGASGRLAFYVYCRQNIRPRDIVRRVAIACGCRSNTNIDIMIAELRFYFNDRRVLIVLDEAQHLSIECFETLRELLDQPPYASLLFSGSHDLKAKFDSFSATLEQWNSRIVAKVQLPGLGREEASAIVQREIGSLLSRRSPVEAQKLAAKLIASATVPDAFNGNRNYINIRTLTNALDQIKAGAEKQESAIGGQGSDEEAVA